jgi:ABC-2 type transport system ATP-binding protein
LTGPAAEADQVAEGLRVVHTRRGEAQAHLLIGTNGSSDRVPPGWETHPVSLEELTLAYLRQPGAAALPGPASGRETEASEMTK